MHKRPVANLRVCGGFLPAWRGDEPILPPVNSPFHQEAVAPRLGVTDKAVSKWERGLSCPDTALGLLGLDWFRHKAGR